MFNKIKRTINNPKKVKRSSLPFHFNDFDFNENMGISATNKIEKIIPRTNIVNGFEMMGKTMFLVATS